MIAALISACMSSAPPVMSPPTEDTSPAEISDSSSPDSGVRDTGAPLEPLPASWSISAGAATIPAGAAPFLTLREDIPLADLTPVSRGRELFIGDWEGSPAGTVLLSGLGPLFQSASCVSCHPATGRPQSLLSDGRVSEGLLLRLQHPGGGGDPTYGVQLQPDAIAGVPAEAAVTWASASSDWVLSDDVRALSAVSFSLSTVGAALSAETTAGPRLSPQLAGMGLLDAVSDAEILSAADPDDLDGDGISGRGAWLASGALGRFGWKASQPSAAAQSAAAFSQDMGITSPDLPEPSCTAAQEACLAAAALSVGEELSAQGLSDVVLFMGALGVPERRVAEASAEGAALFQSVGCAACHRPSLVTAPDTVPSYNAGIEIWAHTDLLLHDMGPGLADTSGEGAATAAEWRTPPLWGLGLVEAHPGARFLHDGRAADLEEAIGWHGGEGAGARDRYAALSGAERALLLAYLRAL